MKISSIALFAFLNLRFTRATITSASAKVHALPLQGFENGRLVIKDNDADDLYFLMQHNQIEQIALDVIFPEDETESLVQELICHRYNYSIYRQSSNLRDSPLSVSNPDKKNIIFKCFGDNKSSAKLVLDFPRDSDDISKLAGEFHDMNQLDEKAFRFVVEKKASSWPQSIIEYNRLEDNNFPPKTKERKLFPLKNNKKDDKKDNENANPGPAWTDVIGAISNIAFGAAGVLYTAMAYSAEKEKERNNDIEENINEKVELLSNLCDKDHYIFDFDELKKMARDPENCKKVEDWTPEFRTSFEEFTDCLRNIGFLYIDCKEEDQKIISQFRLLTQRVELKALLNLCYNLLNPSKEVKNLYLQSSGNTNETWRVAKRERSNYFKKRVVIKNIFFTSASIKKYPGDQDPLVLEVIDDFSHKFLKQENFKFFKLFQMMEKGDEDPEKLTKGAIHRPVLLSMMSEIIPPEQLTRGAIHQPGMLSTMSEVSPLVSSQ